MTSENEAFKTNEFLRRRKLRIQQVREQSKEIAKRIRQRSKVEKLKEVGELDAKKQKEYFHHQDKLVKRLEQLYAAGVRNVGASHKHASEVNVQDVPEKLDVSKKRGKEAVAELRRKKQEQLDEQKKLLDRKLQARETANEISRDKSSNVANKLLKATSSRTGADTTDNGNTQLKPENQTGYIVSKEVSNNKKDSGNKAELVDMATQWNYEELPGEWEPHIPELLISKDDKQTPKETAENEVRPDLSKPLNLFALSDEMPSSLRGGLTDDSTCKSAPKTTLNLVSEYLQNRDLHLREYDYTVSKKKHDVDLQSIRNTILRTRTSNNEGILQQNVCHVADVQVVPVPSWHAENRYGNCPQHSEYHRHTVPSRQYKTITNNEINQIFSSIRPKQHDMPSPSPVLRGVSPFKRSKFDQKTIAGRSSQKSTKSSETEVPLVKKKSVTMYDHSTRDTKDIPCVDKKLVVRDAQAEEDAYSQAARESASVANDDKHQKKLQDMRNKIAVTKQNVEKEYKDTMAFLKSMPKDKSKPIKYAYMDEERQESHKEIRQKKMQGEFKKIEKECKREALNKMNANPTPKTKRRTKSKSPDKFDSDDDFEANDFQYSWMPVPDTDKNLAIHTIPTNLKERKSGSGVHFSKVDSYHEYRSRHKHTPPTKDTNSPKKQLKKDVKAMVIEENSDNSGNNSTFESEVFSSDTLTPREAPNSNADDAGKLSDAERIIIYKILDTRVSKGDNEKKNKVMTKIAKSLNSTEKINLEADPRPSSSNSKKNKAPFKHRPSKSAVFERINEGIYKTVNERRDNITSMYYSESAAEDAKTNGAGEACGDADAASKTGPAARGHKVHWESSDEPSTETRKKFDCCCKNESSSGGSCKKAEAMPSATTSTSSFRTATNAITQAQPMEGQVDGGYIKLLDDDGQEAGKFYIGASGFIKNDAYEVIIQLKKKDDKRESVNVEKTGATPLLEENKKDSVLIKNNKDPNIRQKTESPISEQKAKTVDQNKSLHEIDINKQYKELEDTAIATENTEEIRIVSSDVQAGSVGTENKIKEPESHEGPSSSKGHTVPKQATTCTQTSFENLDERHRPMRISSTSTAYMSPPEFVLPNFLKQDHKISLSELQDFAVNSNLEGIESINQESLCCGDFEYCRCKRCIYEKEIMRCRRSRYKEHMLKAPPNTMRSDASELESKVTRVEHEEKRHYNHKSKHIHSCRKRSGTKAPLIYFAKYNRSTLSTKRSCQKLPSVNSKSIKLTKYKNLKDSNMNPVIKSYVNKLLNLNKKALRAIEVANQDCTSVTTPGSSVIEVPLNKNRKTDVVEPKISLEQIKEILIQDIINSNERNKFDMTRIDCHRKCFSSYGLKKRSTRKVKSLYVSKKLSKSKSNNEDTSDKEIKYKKHFKDPTKSSSKLLDRKSKTKSPTKAPNLSSSSSKTDEYVVQSGKGSIKSNKTSNHDTNREVPIEGPASVRNPQSTDNSARFYEPPSKETASELESNGVFTNLQLPSSTSTQTNLAENNLMKLAEDKLQNMEKIAELTEKCTKRLSSLAKVLEQVRKNKTMAYSQISDSDSDKMSDKMLGQNKKTISSCDKLLESKIKSNDADTLMESIQPESTNVINKDNFALEKTDGVTDNFNYVPLLSNIPKPSHKTPSPTEIDKDGMSPIFFSSNNTNDDLSTLKVRAKPPPALSRINLRQGHDLEHVVPHELSTVAEVDSPLSTKLISQFTRNDSKEPQSYENGQYVSESREKQFNPDLLQSGAKLTTGHTKMSNDSSDDSKIQMMDLKKFNEIMLKPFISIQDYVKQCNVPTSIDDGSNIEQHPKESPISDDISSLHSDGSLPDVIAELLKRNVIKEPFKFDTASNVNSTTASSESTFSVLALSKAKMEKKSHALKIQNKENIAETSDSMSISSNPDLEHAFKQLGMGWASSTLKKTKERLALSSSSNTSSSSTGMHLKIKANNLGVPYLLSNSVSSLLDSSKKEVKDPLKNAEQQTSQINSMTVKDFLTNQLAKKITFTNKSLRDGTEEFISLYETRMPEEIQQSSQIIHEMSGTSGGNRARTSTPVQIFKSMAYHSSSSSNISNGLFSNADELSSVKGTSNSIRNHSTSDKDDLTIPNYNLKLRKGLSDTSKSD